MGNLSKALGSLNCWELLFEHTTFLIEPTFPDRRLVPELVFILFVD